jgi:pilus assembly protein FimV
LVWDLNDQEFPPLNTYVKEISVFGPHTMSLLLRSSCIAVLALAAATGIHAAELGDASVRSYTGQPLSADIELTDLTAQELGDLQVRLARPDVFQGANVKMNPALAGANIAIVRRDNRRVLHVTTAAPVQGEVLHLYFQLVSGGKERVRGVTLWLSPDPAPAPAPAPVAAPAAIAAAAPDRAMKSAARHAGGGNAPLVAIASPGKEATPGEQALLGAVERAFAARGGKIETREEKKVAPVPGPQEIRKQALKHASSADDFRRVVKRAKPVAAEKEPEPEAAPRHEPEHKAPQRSFLPSKADLAEAARATRASIEGGGQPAAQPKAAKPAETAAFAAPAKAMGAEPDAAMLSKLAELEGKLKTLQTQLGIANEAGAARVAAPVAAGAAKAQAVPAAPQASTPAATVAPPTPVATAPKSPDAATVAAAAAQSPVPAARATVPAPATGDAATAGSGAAPHAEVGGGTAAEPSVKPEEPKARPEEKKEAAPPPPEPKKEIKISRPKLLTFLFAGSLVLLVIFGIIVHFVRKAKMKRSPIVRQSWNRGDDDVTARVEPAMAPQPESKAA